GVSARGGEPRTGVLPPGRMGSMAPDEAPLRRFSAATREWFSAAFAAPTAAQAGAWDAISAGKHALVVAPTGSGKTLAAFLWSLDRDRKSTRLNSSHVKISYAVFCLKKKKNKTC